MPPEAIRDLLAVDIAFFPSASSAVPVHALLSRPYLKGRDVFDLIWYLADPGWPEPNLAMLNAALAQTGYPGAALTRRSWKRAVAHRVTALDPAQVTDDVRPFLDTPDEAPTAVEDLLRLLR